MREILADYAFHLHTLTGHFTEVRERFPEAAKGIGEDYPNWPSPICHDIGKRQNYLFAYNN